MNEYKKDKILVLSGINWWSDLGTTGLPPELVMFLRGAVGNHISGYRQETATPRMIELAKEFLQKGIQIGEESYDIMVCKPYDKKTGRAFFVLAPKWPGGELHRLSEL